MRIATILLTVVTILGPLSSFGEERPEVGTCHIFGPILKAGDDAISIRSWSMSKSFPEKGSFETVVKVRKGEDFRFFWSAGSLKISVGDPTLGYKAESTFFFPTAKTPEEQFNGMMLNKVNQYKATFRYRSSNENWMFHAECYVSPVLKSVPCVDNKACLDI